LDAVLYADDDEDDDADFRFTVMVKETEIVAELAEVARTDLWCLAKPGPCIDLRQVEQDVLVWELSPA